MIHGVNMPPKRVRGSWKIGITTAALWLMANASVLAQEKEAPPPNMPAVKSIPWEEIKARWSSQPTNETLKAAEGGDVTARHYLGRFHSEGMGGVTNLVEGAKWYRQAAELGFPNSQNNLGYAYLNGWGVTKDVAEAERWFRLAANQGFAAAQRHLAEFLSSTNAPSERQQESRFWLERAAFGGDVDAMVRLGRNLSRAESANSLYWYKKAYSRGRTDIGSNIGWIYVDGGDNEEALHWFRRGIELGDSYCELSFGWMILEGRGVEEDFEEGLKWVRKAADKGNPAAIRNLGRIHAHDQLEFIVPTPPNYREAARLYRLAAEKGDADAAVRLKRFREMKLISEP